MKLSHAQNSWSLFSLRPLIDRFKNFLSRRTFFRNGYETLDNRWAERMNRWICQNIVDSSVHCRTIFRRLQYPWIEGGGGAEFVRRGSGVGQHFGRRFGIGTIPGGRPIGQALTAQFHRRTPKEFPRFFRGRCHCASVFPRLPFIRPLFTKKAYNGKKSDVSISIESSKFFSIDINNDFKKSTKNFAQSKWFVDSFFLGKNRHSNSNHRIWSLKNSWNHLSLCINNLWKI